LAPHLLAFALQGPDLILLLLLGLVRVFLFFLVFLQVLMRRFFSQYFIELLELLLGDHTSPIIHLLLSLLQVLPKLLQILIIHLVYFVDESPFVLAGLLSVGFGVKGLRLRD